MKPLELAGVLVVLFGVWVLWNVWPDPVEGKFLRPAAALVILGGILLYAEGFKRDIIDRLKLGRDENPKKEHSRR